MASFFIARRSAMPPLLSPRYHPAPPAAAADAEARVAGMAASWDWLLRRLSRLLSRWSMDTCIRLAVTMFP